jgi:hypothetical protein
MTKVIWRIIYISFGISPPTKILQISSEIGLTAFKRVSKAKLELVFVLSYGQYGMSAMILFLTNQNMLLFCRLFLLLFIGPLRSYVSSQRSTARPWILGAPIWRRSFRTYSAGAVGSLIEE